MIYSTSVLCIMYTSGSSSRNTVIERSVARHVFSVSEPKCTICTSWKTPRWSARVYVGSQRERQVHINRNGHRCSIQRHFGGDIQEIFRQLAAGDIIRDSLIVQFNNDVDLGPDSSDSSIQRAESDSESVHFDVSPGAKPVFWMPRKCHTLLLTVSTKSSIA